MSPLRLTLGLCAALNALAACGGSQPPIGTPGAMPQRRAIATFAERGRSWMLPQAKSGDLLYVATSKAILILTYPSARMVGTIPSSARYPHICTDPRNGRVFVTEESKIYEYAHGSTALIKTLKAPSGYGWFMGCAIDPNTGDLAAAIYENPPAYTGSLLIYHGARGNPTVFEDSAMLYYYYPAYDSSGNVFVVGDTHSGGLLLAEVPHNSDAFTDITLNEDVGFSDKIVWDGMYLTFYGGNETIYQVQITGSYGSVVNTVHLINSGYTTYWIQGDAVVAEYGRILKRHNERVGIWPYPAGGKAAKVATGLTKGKRDILSDLTVSVAPSR